MASSVTPKLVTIRDELERILASAPFAGSHRSQQFLQYVVEHAIEDGDAEVKEYTIKEDTIAIEVFGRNSSYDPAVDATVRVEAGRLRSRLREYYAGDGRNDDLIIDVPKGGYHAVFRERAHAIAVDPVMPPGGVSSDSGQIAEVSGAAPWGAKKPGWLRWGVATACLLSAVLVWVAMRHHGRPEAVVALPPPHDLIRFAVLPFSNDTGNVANNYLTEGLRGNVIRQLSELPRLHVMTRAAVDRVKRADVANALGVAMILTGSLRRDADGRLVMNSELSSVQEGTVVSSRQYMADESDLASVQADIVQDVIHALGIELDARQSADARRPSTTNAAAFQAFLHGESEARDPSQEGLHAALRNYEEAIRRDPQFALAYASLAESHAMLGLYYEPAGEHMPLARQYAERALLLDGHMGQAHGTLGLVELVYEWNLRDAENELASAETRLSAIHTLSCTSHLHHFWGSDNIRHAEEDLRRLLEFDPYSASLIGELGCVSYYGGRYDDSIRYYREAIAADPRAPFVYWGAGRSLAMAGRYHEALETLRQFKGVNGFEPPIITAEIGYSEAASGDRDSALATVKQLEGLSTHTYVDPYLISLIYLGMKDRDRTYDWLNRAYEARSPFLISIATDPKWSRSRDDPRFQQIWDHMMESGRAASSSQAKLTSLQ